MRSRERPVYWPAPLQPLPTSGQRSFSAPVYLNDKFPGSCASEEAKPVKAAMPHIARRTVRQSGAPRWVRAVAAAHAMAGVAVRNPSGLPLILPAPETNRGRAYPGVLLRQTLKPSLPDRISTPRSGTHRRQCPCRSSLPPGRILPRLIRIKLSLFSFRCRTLCQSADLLGLRAMIATH
jgi:hypothetical protein